MSDAPSTRRAARRRKRLVRTASQGVVLAMVVAATSAFAVLHKTVTIDVDGSAVQVQGFGRTVGDILAQADVDYSAADLVAPEPTEGIGRGGEIVVRHARALDVVVDGREQQVTTTALTVGEAVDGLGLRASDVRLSASRSAPLDRGTLRVSTLKTIHLAVDGQVIDGVSNAGTVRDALKDIGLVLEDGDQVSVPLDATAVDGLVVMVTRAHTSGTTETEAVPFDEKEVDDPTLEKGEKRITTKGRAGVRTTTYRLDVVGGVVVGRTAVASVVTVEPVTQVVAVGTLELPDVDDIKVTPGSAKAIGKQLAAARGWTGSQFVCLVELWDHESGWRVTAANTSSGAYGIPQALPGSKMATVGADWRTNPVTQIKWGLKYVAGRYGTPCAALAFQSARGWY